MTWQQKFTNEFGIHFSESELQFALAFIEEELQNVVGNEREREWKGLQQKTLNYCNHMFLDKGIVLDPAELYEAFTK